ncbi:MAG TPA: hypothetical protein VN944_03795, partial [Nitrospiria bacterium]|nr:hypothetical protein [Nitrospiria bacterium]
MFKETVSIERVIIMQKYILNVQWILGALFLTLIAGQAAGDEPLKFGAPKGDEGTRIFKSSENPFYSGLFHLTGQKTTLVGSMKDETPWDHMDYIGSHLQPVQGQI